MKRINSTLQVLGAVMLVLAVSIPALAGSPNPTGVVLNERIFNDCPSSTLVSTDNYPAMVRFDDQNLSCGGFANLHNWRFSEDGVSAIEYVNENSFRASADLTLTGTGCEGGLSVSPWWSPDVDGRFNVRIPDGEIACFGGRLPFYSFTSSHGINYAAGEVINIEVTYLPNSLAQHAPATIQYDVLYLGNSYSSGPLPFDEGNPAEDPPHGVWGMLSPAQVGGYVQMFLQGGNPAAGNTATWENVLYADLGTVATELNSFGQVKALFGQ